MKAIIIMRDLLEWPRALAHRLSSDGLDVVLLDNASTYKPLLRWYGKCPYRVVRLPENHGHCSPWTQLPGLTDEPYVVSDPDIDMTGVPPDWLERALALLPDYAKVGLPISTEEVDDNALGMSLPWYDAARTLIDQWRDAREVFGEPGIVPIPVDTTLAVYAAGQGCGMTGVCLPWKYAVNHMPWHFTPETISAEYEYYVTHAERSATLATQMKGSA